MHHRRKVLLQGEKPAPTREQGGDSATVVRWREQGGGRLRGPGVPPAAYGGSPRLGVAPPGPRGGQALPHCGLNGLQWLPHPCCFSG